MRCVQKEDSTFRDNISRYRVKKFLISNYEFNSSLPFLRNLSPVLPTATTAATPGISGHVWRLCLNVTSSFCLPRGSYPFPSSGRQLHLALHLSNTFLDRKLIKFSNSHKSATFFNLRLHKLAGMYQQRGKPRL